MAAVRSGNQQSLNRDVLAPPDLEARVAELAKLWPALGEEPRVTIHLSARLTRSLGRADLISGRISLAAWLSERPELLDQALCHELAHIVAFRLVGRSERPHGARWQRLIRLVGYEPVRRIPVLD